MASHAAQKWPTPSKPPVTRTQSAGADPNAPAPATGNSNNLASSSVSSPSAHDADCAEVDELLEGIDRVRIDDLWTTPRSAAPSPGTAPFRAGLFAPPSASGIAAISRPPALRSKPLQEILAAEPNNERVDRPGLPRTTSEPGRRAHQPSVAFAQACSHNHDHACEHPHAPSVRSAQAPRLARAQSAAAVPHGGNQRPTALADPNADFPHLFKVYPCATAAACYAAGTHADCFYYHAVETDRRRAAVGSYRPHMCRFVEEAGGCRKGDRCPFAHNDFERRYHPDRFGKETCRDFLRGDCPRKYCTFRHEVSDKVEKAISAIDAMCDKEVLQLVLKLSDARGRALSEKLVRRFGHGKKHSGWKLEGFNPRGRDDQKVKHVTSRVEEVKRRLRAAGERKWAASLKTSSLRDMMSGVRKVAEEMRERGYRAAAGDEEARACVGPETQRLIRAVFSNTNWSCHSQEGDNPFVVTPENQSDAMTALERLVDKHVAAAGESKEQGGNQNAHQAGPPLQHARSQPAMHFQPSHHHPLQPMQHQQHHNAGQHQPAMQHSGQASPPQYPGARQPEPLWMRGVGGGNPHVQQHAGVQHAGGHRGGMWQ